MNDSNNIVAIIIRVDKTCARRRFADARQDECFIGPPFGRATI